MNNKILQNVLVGGAIIGFGVAASLGNTNAIHSILSVYVTTAILVLSLFDYDRSAS